MLRDIQLMKENNINTNNDKNEVAQKTYSFEFQPCGRTPQVDYLLC